MKKILFTSIAVAVCSVSAFGQGEIIFENTDNSSDFGWVALNSTSGPMTGSGLVVELFWNNGSSFVLEDTFTSTFTGNGSGGQFPGTFNAGEVTIPQSGTQTFEVEGFFTSGTTAYSGITVAFTAPVNVSPPLSGTDLGSSWTAIANEQGGLVLNPVPEPSTIALGGLGGVVLWLSRRRK